jgi:hypothetical protein
MKPRHAAALALLSLLPACASQRAYVANELASIHEGPSTAQLSAIENEYQDCVRSDYTDACEERWELNYRYSLLTFYSN